MKLLITLFLIFIISISFAQVLKGKVIRVADGDTITLLDSTNTQIRIRLYGIDCPESGQDFGQVAKKFTSDLCFGNFVSVEVRDIDRYGRTVGIVFTPDSINLNLALLHAGLAWHYKYFDKSEEFSNAESEAKALKKGLWLQPNAIAPWEFRTIKR